MVKEKKQHIIYDSIDELFLYVTSRYKNLHLLFISENMSFEDHVELLRKIDKIPINQLTSGEQNGPR